MNKILSFLKKYRKKPLYAFILSVILIFSIFSNQLFSDKQKLNDSNNSKINRNNVSPSINSLESLSDKNLYKIDKVIDGDTIDVQIDGKAEKVRLIGINTPETVDPRRSVECFGKEASNKTKELLTNEAVYLENDATQDNRDKYNRLLRYVYLEDGTSLNYLLITQGFAYEYTYDVPYKYQLEFKKAQQEAQNSRIGLWSPDACKN